VRLKFKVKGMSGFVDWEEIEQNDRLKIEEENKVGT